MIASLSFMVQLHRDLMNVLFKKANKMLVLSEVPLPPTSLSISAGIDDKATIGLHVNNYVYCRLNVLSDGYSCLLCFFL